MYDDNGDEIERTGYDDNEKRGLPSWEIGLLIAVVFVLGMSVSGLMVAGLSIRH